MCTLTAYTKRKIMIGVNEIEEAVQRLTPAELDAFRTWFTEFDAAAWDRQMEDDVATGRLDALADEALEDLRAGRCTDRCGAAPIRGFGLVIGNFPTIRRLADQSYQLLRRNPRRPSLHFKQLGAFGPFGSACITGRLPWKMETS